MRSTAARAMPRVLRFLVGGGINTIVTYIVYLMLIRFMNYNLAYAICYVIGIVVSYWLNLKFVFRETGSVLKFALYPLVYLIQYVVGAAVLNVFVSTLGGAKEYGPVVVVIVTLPVTYILSRVVLTRNGSTEDARQRS